MITCYNSNNLDKLFDALIERLRDVNSVQPFETEYIAVQSQDMAHWLRMKIADELKVCMNFEFPFPQKGVMMLMNCFSQDDTQVIDTSRNNKEQFLWTIYQEIHRILDEDSDNEMFKNNVIRYLHNDSAGLERKSYQLATLLADLLDQYKVYRPEMILEWEDDNTAVNKEQEWQAHFWRVIRESSDNTDHLASLCYNIRRDKNICPTEKYKRFSFFGINQIPPIFLDALKLYDQRSAFTEINFYATQPSNDYWGDLKDEKQSQYAMKRFDERSRNPLYPGSPLSLSLRDEGLDQSLGQILYEENIINNPLLGGMGRLGQDFQNLLIDSDINCDDYGYTDFINNPEDTSLLTVMQNDIYHLINRTDKKNTRLSNKETPVDCPFPIDNSIEIHSCFGAAREVEALHDYLLHLFNNNDGTLFPEDVMVMAPDIDRYSPYIQAVFDNPEDIRQRFHYSISDRPARNCMPVIDTFLDLLKLLTDRFRASELISIVEGQVFKEAFNFSDDDLEQIKSWLNETGFRWGVDEEHKKSAVDSDERENTFAASLDRLMAGYAFMHEEHSEVNGVFPNINVEGQSAHLLGDFMILAKKLRELKSKFNGKKSLSQWCELMNEIVVFFFERTEDHSNQSSTILTTVEKLSKHEDAEKVSISVGILTDHLEVAFSNPMPRSRFMTGGISFCSMLPMRSIPFKVICLLGMNDHDFPRQNHTTGVDLISKKRHLGDRNRRDDDRYLFLETILAAKEKLFISYIGQSHDSLKKSPPSVVVSELIDCINDSFHFDGDPKKDFPIREHRLQPFHPTYYTDKNSGSMSFSKEYCETAKALEKIYSERKKEVPFDNYEILLPETEIEGSQGIIDINDLISFYQNPSKYFATHVLGIRYPYESEMPYDVEGFEMDYLTRYKFRDKLSVRGNENHALKNLYHYNGMLAPGHPGILTYKDELAIVEAFLRTKEGAMNGRAEEEFLLQQDDKPYIEIGEHKVGGKIDGIFAQTLIHARPSGIKRKDFLATLIKFSFWAYASRSAQQEAVCIGTGDNSNGTMEALAHPIDEGDDLVKLLDYYKTGLRKPLCFFPDTSAAWCAETYKEPEGTPTIAAQRKWDPAPHSFPESSDSYIKIFFRNPDFNSEEFKDLADLLFKPRGIEEDE